jgi:hypothetical protein
MPFVTVCSFCPHQLKVPDAALGASLRCPACGNYFTVAPAELAPVKQPARPPVVEKRSPPPPQASIPADHPWWLETPPSAAPASPSPEPPHVPPPVADENAVPDSSEPPPFRPTSSLPGWINVWGAIAFFLASVALLSASLSLPRWLAMSLAGLGLLLSLAGVLGSREEWRIKDSVWLTLGGSFSGVLLLLAAFAPSWLNVRWCMDFDVPEPDRNQQIMVSRDNKTDVKELTGGDRVDAETHAIRQGDLLIRVESAVVDRPTAKDPPTLFITLHIANIGPLHPITYHGQAVGERRAVVRDSRGKELPRRDLGAQAHKAGQLTTASILPNHDVKDVLAVEPPWSGTEHVELDLPAAAWGREGVCKFTIARNFIVQKTRGK